MWIDFIELHRTRVLGLSASLLAGRTIFKTLGFQTTPGPRATVQKSEDYLAVLSHKLAVVQCQLFRLPQCLHVRKARP